MSPEGGSRSSRGNNCDSAVANTNLVPAIAPAESIKTYSPATVKDFVSTSNRSPQNTSTLEITQAGGMENIRSLISKQGFSESVTDIIMDSWRDSTKKQYGSFLNRWFKFSRDNDIDPVSPSLAQTCDYLMHLYSQGLSYSAINTARSALSSFISTKNGVSFGQEPIVVRLMNGFFNRRATTPRYTSIWNPDVVMGFLKDKSVSSPTLKELTFKLLMLLALGTAQRCQTFHLMDITLMDITDDRVTFNFDEPLKHEKAGKTRLPVSIQASQDKDLCVIRTLKQYLTLTQPLRKHNTRLFISYCKPHKPVTRDTLRRWIITTMTMAGVNTKIFKAHSTRAASTSASLRKGVPLSSILKAAQWSSLDTFKTFYDKPLDNTNWNI